MFSEKEGSTSKTRENDWYRLDEIIESLNFLFKKTP